jgi:peroxiredoxin (alkyl hydroperoxide reductase subunit C)
MAGIGHGHEVAQILQLDVGRHGLPESDRRYLSKLYDQSISRGRIPRAAFAFNGSRPHDGTLSRRYSMLGIGQKFPQLALTGVVSNDMKNAFQPIDASTFAGKWKVVFFWPKDFTFVCPTEIAGFAKLDREFRDRDAQILGVSTDSEFVHLAWRRSEADLKDLPFPMLSDLKRELTGALGILDPKEGVAQRATFIVDPDDVIRFVYVTDLSVGRNPQEVLRVLDALQTDELCPCNWTRGEETLKAA